MQGDYLDGSSVDTGGWEGQLTQHFGLEGKAFDVETFAALVHNIDPRTLAEDFGDRLKTSRTPSKKLLSEDVEIGMRVLVPGHGEGEITGLGLWEVEVRLDQGRVSINHSIDKLRHPRALKRAAIEQRITPRQRTLAGWDMTFSVPKGASLVWAAGDNRIKEAFHAAVRETMAEIETFAQTRIRRGSGDNKMNENQDTGSLLWNSFTHDTSRPVQHPNGDVTIDPHLHQHVFVHNVTWDEKEGRFKAMNSRAIKERAAYFESQFEARMGRKMYELGYDIQRRGKFWEISDISPKIVADYSQRQKEIKELAAKLNITSAKAMGELGARSRSSKSLGRGVDLKAHLQERSSTNYSRFEWLAGRARHNTVEPGAGPLAVKTRLELVQEAIDYALERALERRSTAYVYEVLTDANIYGGAARCLPEEIQEALYSRTDIFFGDPDKTRRVSVTTLEVARQEHELRKLVESGRNQYQPLIIRPRVDRKLSAEQMATVTHVYSSTDMVMGIRGRAGTGKSFTLTALVKELERNNINPVALAPTVSASRGSLREAGIEDANTLAMFLSNSQDGRILRKKGYGGLIILDEAGLASTRNMLDLMQAAKKLNARVLLVGDTGQLMSPDRGDAMRLLEASGLAPAKLEDIYRQKNPTYKTIVELMAEGKPLASLEKAQQAGYVSSIAVEAEPHEDIEAYSARVEYAAAKEAAHHVTMANEAHLSSIVVAPTHALGKRVSRVIREQLQTVGHLGQDCVAVEFLRRVDRPLADRRDATHSLEEDDVAIMNRDDKSHGLRKGERLFVQADKNGKFYLHRSRGFQARIEGNLDPKSYNLFKSEELPFAIGDKVKAFEPIDGMIRGDLGTIAEINVKGRKITLTDGRQVSLDSKYLGYGYVSTAHAAQGPSFGVAIYMGMRSAFPAITMQGTYVGITRGVHKLAIITDDFEGLKNMVRRSAERTHGLEVVYQAHIRKLHEQGVDASELDVDFENILDKKASKDKAAHPARSYRSGAH